MTRDDIIRMAREAGCVPVRHPNYDNDVQIFAAPDVLERFAALVAATERERLLSTEIHSCHADCQRFACVQTRKAVEAEREACAKVCEEMFSHGALDIADAIRARGEKE
jgi:hypothetical protein